MEPEADTNMLSAAEQSPASNKEVERNQKRINYEGVYTAVAAVIPPSSVHHHRHCHDNASTKTIDSCLSGDTDDSSLLPPLQDASSRHSRGCGSSSMVVVNAVPPPDEVNEDRLTDHRRNNNSRQQQNLLLGYCKMYSLGLGLLVGCFIQLSSLGANFLLTVLFGKPCQVPRSKIVVFSLVWSFFTSFMGILVLLLIVRSLVPIAWATSSTGRGSRMVSIKSSTRQQQQQPEQRAITLPEQALLYMECFFAIGALVGVCMAWTCTDLVLGFHAHIVHSLITLVAALAWCKVIAFCFGYDHIINARPPSPMTTTNSSNHNNSDLVEPLLEKKSQGHHRDEHAVKRVAPNKNLFKISSLVLGLLVGCFIQFSSLGANFLLNTLYGQHTYSAKNSHHGMLSSSKITREQVLWFSFLWSFFTSSMGILILILLRSLVLTSHKAITIEERRRNEGAGRSPERMVMHMECFFAFGALMGVNAAWIATDALLGLQMHIWHSLATLALALCWCKAVALCFGYCPSDDDDDNCNSDTDNDQEEGEYDLYLGKPVMHAVIKDGILVV